MYIASTKTTFDFRMKMLLVTLLSYFDERWRFELTVFVVVVKHQSTLS